MNLAGRIGRMSATQQGLAAAVVVFVVVAGASTAYAVTKYNSDSVTAAAPSSAAPTPAVTPSAAPVVTPAPVVPPAADPTNPLTGLAPVPTGPVIGVKIDDTGPGRPQVGIDKADIVYIEQAEGGLTRNLAVFSSQKPVVGYIRSVRASDPELLSQYGPVLLAASGGGGDSLTVLDASILKSYIQDRGAKLFYRVDRNASDYINVQLDLAKVSASVTAGGPQSTGLTWNADAGNLTGTPVATTISTKVGSTAVGFSWDAVSKKYVRVINGTRQKAADGALIATPNVIVQFCQVTANPRDVDVMGNPSQFTHSVGSGAVSIFRNGHRVDGTWSRTSSTGGTSYVDAAGNPIALDPGGAWVVLASTGAGVTSS